MNRKQLFAELETTKRHIKSGHVTIGDGAEIMLYYANQYRNEMDYSDDESYVDLQKLYHRIFLDLAALTR